VDLCSERVADQLAEFAGHPKFVGVRHVVQDEPDDDFMVRPEFLRGVSALQRFDLAYDILIYPKQLPAAIELVRKFPEQRFVLDHLAKPFIREHTLSPWSEQIADLSAGENVWCKVSGMVTEAKRDFWKREDFRPYLDVVCESFGVDRLMFGSDWPVCLLAASYEQVYDIMRHYLHGRSEQTRGKLFGGNCARFYLRRLGSVL
jgi:L-fuconolactonase